MTSEGPYPWLPFYSAVPRKVVQEIQAREEEMLFPASTHMLDLSPTDSVPAFKGTRQIGLDRLGKLRALQ